MANTNFYDLTISDVRPLTNQGIALKFDIPEEHSDHFDFIPGQYLTLRATVGGEDIRRSYSICSSVEDGFLEVGIKQVESGAFSNHATTLKPGDTLKVMPPQGRFVAQPGGENNYLLIAAGSGITPCLSIAKSVLALEPDSTITLIYGNSRTNTVMFREDIDALKDKYTNRMQLFHILSRERQDIEFLCGRIEPQLLKTLAAHDLIDLSTFDAAYLCGPQDMTEKVSEALVEQGLEKSKIKTELFLIAGEPVREASANKQAVIDGVPVSIRLDGGENTFTVDGSTETVLAAAQRAGMDLPFSCAGGMCCTCRCKIVSGEASMDVNYSLQDWEIDAGFTLACQTRPTSDRLELDFDAT